MEPPRLYPSMKRTIACIASCVLLLMVSVSVWAAPGDIIWVDNWTEYPVGALLLSVPGTWKVYSSMKVFKYPPTVVLDDARRALRLKADHETMAIGRSFHLDVATTRTLMWEWKPLVLPVGGDVREHAAKRNDQAARVVLWFDASLFTERRAIGYIWDSSAPGRDDHPAEQRGGRACTRRGSVGAEWPGRMAPRNAGCVPRLPRHIRRRTRAARGGNA